MKRIQHLSILTLAGILLMFASTMPTLLQHAGIQAEKGRETSIPPRVASFGGYLYTIGESGVKGSDNAHLNIPRGIAVNSTGHVYVADSGNHRVQVFDKAGIYLYTIGTGFGSGNYQFSGPHSVAVNATGHVYIADSWNARVQVYDKAGIYQYTIGTTGVGVPVDNRHFNSPYGVAVNSTGHVFVVDTGYQRVIVYDKDNLYQFTLGVATVSGDDNGHFDNPLAVAVNATGHIFVADGSNNRVQVFDKAGIYQYTIGVTGVWEPNDNAHLANPAGITVSSLGYVYIGDGSNDRVQVFDKNGIYRYTIGVPRVEGADNAHFNSTTGVAVNATGHLYVVDLSNYRVQVFGNISVPTDLSIAINGGVSDTTTLAVTLNLSASGAMDMCFSNNGSSYTTWEAYNQTKNWTLVGGPGPKTVYFKTRCDTNESSPVTDTITYTLPPTGLSIIIDGGAAGTEYTNVTLTLAAAGATEMCFSNNGTTYMDWEAYGTSKAWILDAVAGPRTVYFKARNNTIEAGPATDSITYFPPLPPTGLSIIINDGATMTASRSVTLVVWASGAEEMCFSNHGDVWTPWEPYATTKEWGFGGGPGLKTVYFKTRNSTAESSTAASIIYTLPPTGLSIAINGGAAETGNYAVTLTISATGATEMCFSNDGVAWSGWEPLAATKVWNLPASAGYKTVYIKARNGTIESAGPVAASITYTTSSLSLSDEPAWVWAIAVVVLIKAVGVVLVIWMRYRKDRQRTAGGKDTRTVPFPSSNNSPNVKPGDAKP